MVRRILPLLGILLLGALAIGVTAYDLAGRGIHDAPPAPTLAVLPPDTRVARPLTTPALAPTRELAATTVPQGCPKPPWWQLASRDITCWQYSQMGPGTVSWVVGTVRDAVVEVQWSSGEISNSYYEVYRQTATGGAWELVARAGRVPVSPDSTTAYTWRDTTATSGTAYRYGVVGVSAFGRLGDMRTSDPITAP